MKLHAQSFADLLTTLSCASNDPKAFCPLVDSKPELFLSATDLAHGRIETVVVPTEALKAPMPKFLVMFTAPCKLAHLPEQKDVFFLQ